MRIKITIIKYMINKKNEKTNTRIKIQQNKYENKNTIKYDNKIYES